MSAQNPYAPPGAEVLDPQLEANALGHFVPEGRALSAGSGWRWFGAAWRIFKVQPLMWWLALIALFAVFIVASLIPFVNLITTLAGPILLAGIAACARSVQSQGRFEFGQIFDGFRNQVGQLILVGLIFLVMLIVIVAALALAFGASGLFGLLIGGGNGEAAMSSLGASVWLILLLYFVCCAIASAAYIFAPYLVFEQNLSAVAAMKASFKGCVRNIGPCIVCLLSYFVWAIAATIPLALGWLILIPVLMLLGYVAYRDIFYA